MTQTTQFRTIKNVIIESAKNFSMGIPFIRDRRVSKGRTTPGQIDEKSVYRSVFMPITRIVKYVPDLEGKRVFEIGPGDHIAAGATMLKAGAAVYVAADRFMGDIESANSHAYYNAIDPYWDTFLPDHPQKRSIDIGEALATGHPDVQIHRIMIEKLHVDSESRFDLVYSFYVGEHVSDIEEFARQTARLLAQNGTAVHLVDFGPHGPWRSYNDAWTFLKFPDWLWHLMGSNRGYPNRYRLKDFTAAFDAAGLHVKHVDIEPGPKLKTASSDLAKQFRGLTEEDITASKALFVLEHKR